jgi:hypothetical protein
MVVALMQNPGDQLQSCKMYKTVRHSFLHRDAAPSGERDVGHA